MASCEHCEWAGRTKLQSRVHQHTPIKCPKNSGRPCLGCQKLIEVDRKIDDLLKTRETLLSDLNTHHDSLLDRLPLEIVSSIFVQCRPVHPDVYTSGMEIDRKELIKAVFAPCHVSRKWREITFSTPELWTLFCARLTENNHTSSVTIVQDWLERSHTLPLFIQFGVKHLKDGSFDYPEPIGHNIRRNIDLVTTHAHRCEVLDLDIPSQYVAHMSITLSTKHLDRLDHLKFNIYDFIKRGSLGLHASPRLLTLWSADLGNIWTGVIGLERLTHVTVEEKLTANDLVRLLKNAPRLSFLTIRNMGRINLDIQNSPFSCPSMHALNVGYPTDSFWSNFSFPSLQSICISQHNHSQGDDGCWAGLQAHLRGTGCSVKQVEFDCRSNCPIPRCLVDVLKLLPNLEWLSVNDCCLEVPFFSAMETAAIVIPATTHFNPAFLGKLKSLKCATYDRSFDWADLIGFLDTIASRPVRSLQSFHFQYFSIGCQDTKFNFVDSDTFQRLMKAVRGLEFQVVGSDGQDLMERLRPCYSSTEISL